MVVGTIFLVNLRSEIPGWEEGLLVAVTHFGRARFSKNLTAFPRDTLMKNRRSSKNPEQLVDPVHQRSRLLDVAGDG